MADNSSWPPIEPLRRPGHGSSGANPFPPIPPLRPSNQDPHPELTDAAEDLAEAADDLRRTATENKEAEKAGDAKQGVGAGRGHASAAGSPVRIGDAFARGFSAGSSVGGGGIGSIVAGLNFLPGFGSKTAASAGGGLFGKLKSSFAGGAGGGLPPSGSSLGGSSGGLGGSASEGFRGLGLILQTISSGVAAILQRLHEPLTVIDQATANRQGPQQPPLQMPGAFSFTGQPGAAGGGSAPAQPRQSAFGQMLANSGRALRSFWQGGNVGRLAGVGATAGAAIGTPLGMAMGGNPLGGMAGAAVGGVGLPLAGAVAAVAPAFRGIGGVIGRGVGNVASNALAGGAQSVGQHISGGGAGRSAGVGATIGGLVAGPPGAIIGGVGAAAASAGFAALKGGSAALGFALGGPGGALGAFAVVKTIENFVKGVAATAGALVGLTVAAIGLSKSFAAVSPHVGFVFAKAEAQDMFRGMRVGQAIAPSAANMMRAFANLKNDFEPYMIGITNSLNKVADFLMTKADHAVKAVEGIPERIAKALIDKLKIPEGAKKLLKQGVGDAFDAKEEEARKRRERIEHMQHDWLKALARGELAKKPERRLN